MGGGQRWVPYESAGWSASTMSGPSGDSIAKARSLRWGLARNQLDDAVKTFNKVITAYAETVAPSLEALRQIDTTMKTSSSPLVPITLLQRRLEPIVAIPEELLNGEEEPCEDLSISHNEG